MKLAEAKALFDKHHQDAVKSMQSKEDIIRQAAECMWYGFKSALKLTNQLEE